MLSTIDPTKPLDGEPTRKADIRANFAAAQQELHRLLAVVVSVKGFGAAGDGATDDTAALQAAFDSGEALVFPPGDYRITQPLVQRHTLMLRGAAYGHIGSETPKNTRISGDFGGPLIHREGLLFNPQGAAQGTQAGWGDTTPVTGEFGTGIGFVARDLRFVNMHDQGSLIQIYNHSAPLYFSGCTFSFHNRGLMLIQEFDALIENCAFVGDYFRLHTTADPYEEAYGLLVCGHTTIVGCRVQGCGTGIRAAGPETNILGARIEVCGIGLQLGGDKPEADGTVSSDFPLAVSSIGGISLESNTRNLLARAVNDGVTVRGIAIQGGGNGPSHTTPGGDDGTPEYGLRVESLARSSSIEDVIANISYHTAPLIVAERVEGRIGPVKVAQGMAGRPASSGLAPLVATRAGGGRYNFAGMPHQPALSAGLGADRDSITAISDLQLRGLKGLNVRDAEPWPEKLGGIAMVSAFATTATVTWEGERQATEVTWNTLTAAAEATDPLPAGTYWYASTFIDPRGETGVDVTAENNNFKPVTVDGGQRVDLAVFGWSTTRKRRFYVFDSDKRPLGYWDLDPGVTTKSDTAATRAAFDGNGLPPGPGTNVPSEQEADAGYAVVATPSWNTTVWVTGEATTGFTLNFGTAAPAGGGTVRWLLFRP